MQCKSWENGLIVHNEVEKENEKLSVRNITSCLRLNLPDSTSIPSRHPIVKFCRADHTSSNSELSETSVCSISRESFGLCSPSLDELVVLDSSLVLSSLSLAHRRLFMCSGQSFEFSHRAIFGGAIVDFDRAGGTSWDWGRWSFDRGMWGRWSRVTNYQRDGGSGSGSSRCFFNSFPSSPFSSRNVFEHLVVSSGSESFPLCSDRSPILSDKDFSVSCGPHFELKTIP